jgi:hypothetical protein
VLLLDIPGPFPPLKGKATILSFLYKRSEWKWDSSLNKELDSQDGQVFSFAKDPEVGYSGRGVSWISSVPPANARQYLK